MTMNLTREQLIAKVLAQPKLPQVGQHVDPTAAPGTTQGAPRGATQGARCGSCGEAARLRRESQPASSRSLHSARPSWPLARPSGAPVTEHRLS